MTRSTTAFGMSRTVTERASAAPCGIAPGAAGRLETLDGLRGLAALLVVLYHFLARWGEDHEGTVLYPHGDVAAQWPVLLVLGNLGVLLFFTLSGFVILMTLERSSGLVDFTIRRIARLWPAMLVCATLSMVLLNASGVTDYYAGWERKLVTPVEYVSSIFFVDPALTCIALGCEADLRWVEGVQWTLWVEVRFYALVAVVFLLVSREWFPWAWCAVQVASAALETLRALSGDQSYGPAYRALSLLLQPEYLAWFSLGIVGYAVYARRSSWATAVTGAVALYAVVAHEVVALEGGSVGLRAGAPAVVATYAVVLGVVWVFVRRPETLRPLASAPLVAIGLASYSLYLFHETPGMVAFMLAAQAGVDPWFALVSTFAAIVLLAMAMHRLVELPGQRLLTAAGRRRFLWLEDRLALLRFERTASPPRGG